MERITWHEYFMDMAHFVSKRSTCMRRQVGAVIVKNKRIQATGYNGVASGLKHCEEVGCIRQKMNIPSGERHELCRAIHAEQNAIVQAATSGLDISGSEIYVTVTPCLICAKMLVAAGVKQIYIDGEYPDQMTMDYLKEAGATIEKIIRK